MKLNPEKLTGRQKAAILFLTMGEEFTTPYFKELDEKSIKKIGKYMSEITYIPSDVLNVVVKEFITNYENDVNLVVSGEEFLKEVVEKTLDKDSAREVFKVIGGKGTSDPFSDLAYIPEEDLVNMIQGEHPQTIALILSYLSPEKAAKTLRLLSPELKADIALRIVKIGQIDREIVNELDAIITKNISKKGVSAKKLDGVKTLANILNEVDGSTEESVLEHIESEDEELAGKIRQKMFIFEDLLQIDDRNFRSILQNIDNQILSKALRTATDEMKQKIFGNLSERASEMLKEDMEVMGAVKLSEVEEAQQEIIKTAKRLESEGKLVIAKGKEDEFV